MTSENTARPLEIVIAGGGIAGEALAFWLARAGHRPVVVERFPALRATGAQVDLRDQGIEIARRMGVLDAIRAHLVHERGVRLVDARGRSRGTILANTSGCGRQSLTSEYEIMRGDLVRILHDAATAAGDVEHVYGAAVESADQHGDRVTVRLSDGRTREADLLVGADGQGSRLRQAMLPAGGPDPYRRFGIHMAYWSVPRIASDDDLRDAYLAPAGRLVWRRSSTATESQPYLVLRETSAEASGVHREPVELQKAFWARRFAGAGWQLPRFLDGLSGSRDFYSQEALQVRIGSWSSGRVVLAGDAAHCASPLSGMGVSGALVGAYVLAGELASSPDDVPRALAAYERTLRPFVESVQDGVSARLLTRGMPATRLGVRLLLAGASVVTALGIPALLDRFSREDRGGHWRLPEYPALAASAVGLPRG